MSTLPEQLQKQVNVAEEFYKKPAEGQEGSPVESKGGAEAEHSAVETPVSVEPTSSQAQPAPAEDGNSDTYAQRWRSLQGIHQTLQNRAQQMEMRVNQLEGLIASMNTVQQQAPVVGNKFLTDKDTEDYGPEMVDMVKRAVDEGTSELRRANQQLQAEIQRLNGVIPAVQKVERAQHVNQEERFWNSLTQQVPDWESINNNQGFKNWLLDADPMTSITRQTYLSDAQQSLDVSRVANIFASWKQQFGTPVKQQSAAKSSKSELERQIAPGRGMATTPSQSDDKKQWTHGDIAKFYDDQRKGVYRGREAEAEALERDIFQAQSDGRVSRKAA